MVTFIFLAKQNFFFLLLHKFGLNPTIYWTSVCIEIWAHREMEFAILICTHILQFFLQGISCTSYWIIYTNEDDCITTKCLKLIGDNDRIMMAYPVPILYQYLFLNPSNLTSSSYWIITLIELQRNLTSLMFQSD